MQVLSLSHYKEEETLFIVITRVRHDRVRGTEGERGRESEIEAPREAPLFSFVPSFSLPLSPPLVPNLPSNISWDSGYVILPNANTRYRASLPSYIGPRRTISHHKSND